MSIVVGVDDLFFLARILDTARQVGVTVEGVPAAKVRSRLAQGGAKAVILDLNSPLAIGMIRELKSDLGTRGIPLVGFVSHVAAEVVSGARNAGCDVVLARSAFSKQLAELLRGLSSEGMGYSLELDRRLAVISDPDAMSSGREKP